MPKENSADLLEAARLAAGRVLADLRRRAGLDLDLDEEVEEELLRTVAAVIAGAMRPHVTTDACAIRRSSDGCLVATLTLSRLGTLGIETEGRRRMRPTDAVRLAGALLQWAGLPAGPAPTQYAIYRTPAEWRVLGEFIGFAADLFAGFDYEATLDDRVTHRRRIAPQDETEQEQIQAARALAGEIQTRFEKGFDAESNPGVDYVANQLRAQAEPRARHPWWWATDEAVKDHWRRIARAEIWGWVEDQEGMKVRADAEAQRNLEVPDV